MAEKNSVQSEISRYISTLLRTHFGKGPTAVYVTVESSFVSIHFRGFLAAMEKNMMNQNELKKVLITRDLIMRNLEPEIMQEIEKLTGLRIQEFYTDWDFEKETGLMIGIIHNELEKQLWPWPDTVNEQAVRDYIDRASRIAQKAPAQTDFSWLDNRTLLVRRSGILLEIEKEFIQNGYLEELKFSRKLLEHRAFQEAQPETVLKGTIEETFLFWNFERDQGYTVFRLGKENPER